MAGYQIRDTLPGGLPETRPTTEETTMSSAPQPTITEHEIEQVERANATSQTPVVFIHGLWRLFVRRFPSAPAR